MAARLLILADDFTGALDTGVRLALAGVATRVATLREGSPRMPRCDEPVLVIDTESRHALPGEAARRVRECVCSALGEGTTFFYKKTDSTLRGNIGAELSALLSASGEDCLFFVPALPAAGRTTVWGVALVNGIPLNETVFAHDPLDPVTDSVVSAIIGRQSDVAVENVPRGSDLPRRESPGKRILVFDAETDADLEDIGRRIKSAAVPRATAGCSGFASVLPRLLDLPHLPVPTVHLVSPMFVVCGSLHEASRAQVLHAEENGLPAFVLDPGFLPAGGDLETARRDLARRIVDALTSTGAAILKTPPSVEDRTVRRGSGELSGGTVSRAIGGVVLEVLSRVRPSTLVVFGGDTAFGVVEALGIASFQPVREISQGVVVSRAQQDGRDLHLVTKAGGFGAPDILMRVRETLGKER